MNKNISYCCITIWKLASETFYKELQWSDCIQYKPYTVTNNRFQLLDNLQENDSPADILSKISQPGKNYCSAVEFRSARVKGDRQATKDIHNTRLQNATFDNPDMKNDLTIPVIVKGQALTRKVIL
jgi:hypothetical protein